MPPSAPLLAVLALSSSALAEPLFGVDVSSPVSAAQAQCMRAPPHNLSFGIVRAWESNGHGFDRNCVEVSKNWRGANISSDVYMFPCSFGLSAASQVAELIGNLSLNSVPFGRIWFDVETNPSPACAWKADKAANCAFMKELVDAAAATNAMWGVYSSIHMWTTLMADASAPNACAAAATLPLWYPHYQTPPDPTFDDFVGFGGWAKPSVKQFYDGVDPGGICSVSVDNNVAFAWPPQA